MPLPAVEAGSTRGTVFLDALPLGEGEYLYEVVALDGSGGLSGPSNLVHFPPLTPPVRFAVVREWVERLSGRGRFVSAEAAARVRQAVALSGERAGDGEFGTAAAVLASLREGVLDGDLVLAPDDGDFEIILDKLTRRLTLLALLTGPGP